MLLVLALGAALGLPPGPYEVGFRVLNHRDASRRTADGALRPVQVAVWYPAAPAGPSAAPTLRYGDYVRTSTRETTLAPLTSEAEQEALSRYRAFLAQSGLAPEAIEAWLSAAMLARPEVPAASGRFPVLLIAQGMGGAVPDQAALAEAMAGHGYVVATTPSPVRLGTRMESEADVPLVAEEQALDLEAALAVVAPRSMADATRVGVVGYSFGARPALLVAGRRPQVRALVSLDGGIGSAAAKAWLSPRALDRAAFRTPVLHVFEEEDPDARPDFDLLASLVGAPRTLARVDGLRHLDFITYGLATATLPALGGPDARRGAAWQAVTMLTLGFLDARVAGRPGDWEKAASAPGPVRVVPFGSAGRR